MDSHMTLQISALQLFTRHALSALIKHRQLIFMLRGLDSSTREASKGISSTRNLSSARGSVSRADQCQPDGDPRADSLQIVFVYDSKLWIKASANRQIKDLWRDCEKRLKVGP